MELERFFKVDISDEEFVQLRTVQDVVSLFYTHLSRKYTLEQVRGQKGELV